MELLPVEIIFRIVHYLHDRDKLNLRHCNHAFRLLLAKYLEFNTLVSAESVRYLSYYDSFQNIRLTKPNIKLPRAVRGLIFEMPENDAEYSWRLPPKLQYLVIRANFRGTPDVLPNITHLDLDSRMLHRIHHLLPVTLTHLTCRFQFKSMSDFPDMSGCHVTHLRLFGEGAYIQINVAHLPRNLTHLKKNKYIHMQNFGDDFFAKMLTWQTAGGLKLLNLCKLKSAKNITSVGTVLTEALPPSIQRLTCQRLVMAPGWHISNLQSLSLAKCGDLDLDAVPQLRHLLVTEADCLLNLSRHQMLECLIVGDNRLIRLDLPSSLRYLRAPQGVATFHSTHLMLTHQDQNFAVPQGVTHLSLGGSIRNLDIMLPESLQVLSITADYLTKFNRDIATLPNLCKIFLRYPSSVHKNQPGYLHTACYLSGYKSYQYISIHDDSESESDSEIVSPDNKNETATNPTLADLTRSDIAIYLEPYVDVDISDYQGMVYHLNRDIPLIDIDFRIMEN